MLNTMVPGQEAIGREKKSSGQLQGKILAVSCSSFVLSFVRQRGSQKEALYVTSKPGTLQITPLHPSLFHSP